MPRGALSEESVYGLIKGIEKNKPVKYLFENPHLIFKPYIKAFVEERLLQFEGDFKKALVSLKKEPIYLDDAKIQILEYGTCFKDEYVIKYPIETIKAKDVEYIIDGKVKEIIRARLVQFNDKEKEAFKDLDVIFHSHKVCTVLIMKEKNVDKALYKLSWLTRSRMLGLGPSSPLWLLVSFFAG